MIFDNLDTHDEKNREYEYFIKENLIADYVVTGGEVIFSSPGKYFANITNTKNQLSIKEELTPPLPEDPEPSGPSGSGIPSKVEKKTPPKPESPKPDPDSEPTPEPIPEPMSEIPTSEMPLEGLVGRGGSSGANDTDVLPGMIPGMSSGGTTSEPDTKVVPGYVRSLPKTGDGLNLILYTLFFVFIGFSLFAYGIVKKIKKN